MQHQIPLDRIGPWGPPMAEAVQKCVHCGFCLPACPTYHELGEEMDSPRGRIVLMKEVLEGRLALAGVVPYVDRCLGCLGCVTACPSGVRYGELLMPFRAWSEGPRHRGWLDRMLRWFVLATLPYPRRFLWAARLGRAVRPARRLLPGRLGAMLDLLPNRLPRSRPLPSVTPAAGRQRARVALLAGCVQQVLIPEINWATLNVLSRNGIEVVVPPLQGCCGALAAHTGAARQAQDFARHNLRAFPSDVDAVLTNAAGCGSGLREYPLWLRGEPEQQAAEQFAGRARDVSDFLAELGITPPPPLDRPRRVAWHDPCHLAHAQKVRSQPRQLLSQISPLEVVEIPGGELCCGSAGTYNLEYPDTAARLGQRKAEAILASRVEAVVTGNIGCMMQIQSHLARLRRSLPVLHTMQLLDSCYRQETDACFVCPPGTAT